MADSAMPAPAPAAPASLLRRLLSDRQFVVAVVVLALSAAMWSSMTSGLKWSLTKQRIAWPAGVVVSDDFRLTDLLTTLGPYERVEEDGVLFTDDNGQPKRDGKPDGEFVIPEEERLILGVGTPADAPLLGDRECNWYVSRYYVDTRPNPFCRLWRLDVTFYNGSADKVAHVPGRCMVASGATEIGESEIDFAAPANNFGWGPSVKINRSRFLPKNGSGEGEILQYYTFSLNGRNEPSWKVVRWYLAASPWEKYGYFAKIQFAPASAVRNVEQADRAAQDFVNHVLPDVLRQLPSAADMDAMNAGRNAAH